jgi:ketosteroid isomerase-like protein
MRTDSGASTMTTEQTKALIDDLYATLGRGDRNHLMEILSEDVVWQMPASVPDGVLHGRERVVRELGTETVRRLFQKGTFRLKIHNIYADGDTAIVQTNAHAITKEDKVYDMEYAWIYSCRDGKITYIREYLDTKRSSDILGWGETR